jgi:two-component system KDP operon response regulator KdpE
MTTRILVIDDDPQLLRALRITLGAHRYEVAVAADGASGLALASRTPPDLVVLDLGLPDMDGVAVVEGLRGWSTAPVIVLSARHAESAKVAALDAGADDYVTKPFGMGELLARIRAALRRAAPAPEEPVVTTAAFTIDLAAKRVTTASGDVRLTPTEWHLLGYWPATRTASSGTANCCGRCGGPTTRPNRTTCGCTWPTCAASSNPTRRSRATSSPSRASGTGSLLSRRGPWAGGDSRARPRGAPRG